MNLLTKRSMQAQVKIVIAVFLIKIYQKNKMLYLIETRKDKNINRLSNCKMYYQYIILRIYYFIGMMFFLITDYKHARKLSTENGIVIFISILNLFSDLVFLNILSINF